MSQLVMDSLQEQEREQLVSFLKGRSILCVLDDTIIHGLSLSLEEITCGPGYVVFHEGDDGDGLYIIKSGSVEVRKNDSDSTPIAYLTAGECFGEMSLVHGEPRAATIRVPEEATILKLSKKASTDLTVKFPLLAVELNKLAEKREIGLIAFEAPGLQGNTAFFDLPTVVQAVVASRQSGYLRIFATAHTPAAKLTFLDGALASAEFKHLTGEHALFELLCSHDPTDFVFERVRSLSASVVKSKFRQIERLLIDGARRSDELTKLVDTVGGLSMTYTILDENPQWENFPTTDNRDVARLVWKLIESDLTIEEMLPMLEVDRFTLLKVLSKLMDRGMIKQLVTLHTADPLASIEEMKSRDQALSEAENSNSQKKQPARLAASIYALNMVASNMATFVPKGTIKHCLEEALIESVKIYPQLDGLKVNPGGKSLDVRGASPELTKRADSKKALHHLMMSFVHLVGQSGES
jgi:hypothetical protein